MTESEFKVNEGDDWTLPDEIKFWGKHTFDDRREVVCMYSIRQNPMEADFEGPAMYVSMTFYLDYEPPDKYPSGRMKPGTSSGDTCSLSSVYELGQVYDIERMARGHFDNEVGDMYETMKELEQEGKLR